MEVRWSNICCRGKVVIITYSECVFVASIIQRAKCMHRDMWSASVCLAVHIFPHYLTKGTIFGETNSELKIRFVFLHKFVSNICHSKKSSP
jgi:hypothetical protein